MRDEQRQQRLAALGVQREIPTPKGEAKMSAVILQLAEPLLKRHAKTPQQAEAIIMLTIAGWNKSMFSTEQQPLIESELIDAFVPKDGRAEDVGAAVEIMERVAERRQKLFPALRKIIVDYGCTIGGGQLTLDVQSAPIPDPASPGGRASRH